MPGQWHEFCDLFHRSYAGKKLSSPLNQLGDYCFCCPHLSGLHTSLFLMSYRVDCLELLDAPCLNGSFWYRNKRLSVDPHQAQPAHPHTNSTFGLVRSCTAFTWAWELKEELWPSSTIIWRQGGIWEYYPGYVCTKVGPSQHMWLYSNWCLAYRKNAGLYKMLSVNLHQQENTASVRKFGVTLLATELI